MSGHVTMRRDGGWTIELSEPILGPDGFIDFVTFVPPKFNHLHKWGLGEISSNFALMSALSGVPEESLMGLTYSDFEKALVALNHLVPNVMRETMSKRPIVTPPPAPPEPPTAEILPEEQPPPELPKEQDYTGPDHVPETIAPEGLPEPEEMPPGFLGAHDPNDPRFPFHKEIITNPRTAEPEKPVENIDLTAPTSKAAPTLKVVDATAPMPKVSIR